MDAYSLGQILREARESKELGIADVVARLKIRQPILEGFEAGEFEISGVPEIQIRGLLRIYARHLELDEEHVLLLYGQMRFALEKGRRGRRGRRGQTEPLEEPFSSTQPLQEYEQVDRRSAGCRGVLRLLLLLLFSAAAIAIIVFVTIELVGTELNGEPSPAPDTAAAQPSETTGVLPTDTPLSDPTVESGRAQYTGAGILVSVLVTQRSWISIQSDGAQVYEGIADADTLLEYTAENEVALSAANALALDVIWNGQRQGQIGERGQRVDMRFTMESAVITLGPGGEPTTIPPTVEIVDTEIVASASPEPAQSDAEEPTPPPTQTSLPTSVPTALPTLTPLPSLTPRPTATPLPTEPRAPTAILPPRLTQVGLPPTKEGA